MPRRKPSISGIFLTSMIVLTVTAIVSMGVLLVAQQVDIFRHELQTLHSQSLEAQKTLLKSEVERTAGLISFLRDVAAKRFRTELTSCVEEAYAAAASLDRTLGVTRGRAETQGAAIDLLRSWPLDKSLSLFVVDLGGRILVTSGHDRLEGQGLLSAPVLKGMVEAAGRQGQGFYSGGWMTDDAGREAPGDLGYVKVYGRFGWIIGARASSRDAEDELKEEVLDRISSIRFGKDGYVFAGTYTGVSLTPPAKGRDMYGVVDANGVKIVQELVSAAKNGGGFVQYRMPRLDGARDAPKISYALALPEWRWYVGAGMYVDDLDAAVASRRASLLRSIRVHVGESSAVLVGLLALILAAAQLARKRLQKNLAVFARFFDQAAWGAARIEPEQVGFLELASLANTANTMIFLRLSAERELRTSEKRYRTIVENLSDALLILSLGGRILDFNENACTLFGYSHDELAAADLSLLADADAEAHWREMLIRLFAADSLVFEVECRRKDGTTLHAEVSAKRVTKEGEGVVQAFVRDVSQRREAEITLRENESLLRTLMDNMGAGVMIVDAETHIIESVNPVTADMVGLPAERIQGQGCHLFMCPADRGACPVTDTGQTVDKSDRILLRPDGTPVPIIKSVKRIRIQGREKLVETFVDISERKRAEEERRKLEDQIRQAQKLESLGILAGGIAHDFNNILMTVLGNAELARDEGQLPAPVMENITQIETAAHRAAELCRQMLTYSGKASVVQEPVDLCSLAEEMVQLVSRSISRKTQVKLLLDKEIPPMLGDPSQVRQVVMNLIINSAEAIADASGLITVAVGSLHCDAAGLRQTELSDELPPGQYIHLEVTDDGCGMDDGTRARIFDPFFTTKFKGRGLGLAAVLGIVRAHKGALKVTSEPGRGTTFRILFPAAHALRPRRRGGDEPPVAGGRWSGTILLADDEESLRRVGAQMLERLGFRVLTAVDGMDAVEIYSRTPRDIDVVVLDLTMPRMDGADALAALRKLDPGARVLLASGHSEEAVAGRFSDMGIAGILQKPYTLSKLREAITAVLGPGGHPAASN